MLGSVEYYINNKRERNKSVVHFRKMVADYLLEIGEDGKTVYDRLSRGYLREYAEAVSPADTDYYGINRLYRLLNSKNFVGLEVLEVVSNFLDINIIIWDDSQKNVYRNADKELLFKEKRSSIVMIYNGDDHFDLMGLNIKGKTYTHFTEDNPLIIRLDNIW
jgi:hypothetical protein